jgi:hypothetical protein
MLSHVKHAALALGGDLSFAEPNFDPKVRFTLMST